MSCDIWMYVTIIFLASAESLALQSYTCVAVIL